MIKILFLIILYGAIGASIFYLTIYLIIKTMTKKEAKELCILKWEYIVENNGSSKGLIKKYPQLKKLNYGCAYCDKYITGETFSLLHCAKCPIRPKVDDYHDIEYVGCSQYGHPYSNWSYNNTKENAQLVLDLIKERPANKYFLTMTLCK